MAEHGHDHATPGHCRWTTDRRALTIALVLLVAFMVFEVGAAVASNSLALLADAGHMLVDVGAIAGSLVAIRLAARPETGSHTYGMKRAEILAAAGNAIALAHRLRAGDLRRGGPAGPPVPGRRRRAHGRGRRRCRRQRGRHADAWPRPTGAPSTSRAPTDTS